MNVVHISTVHPTFDGRIFHKECVSLAKAGYNVHLIIGHTKKEKIDGVVIHPLPKFGNRLDRIRRGNKIAFNIALEINADVYHLHDPELLPLGLKLKQKGFKVVYDMHELVGLMIRSKKWIPLILRWTMEKLYMYYENKAFQQFDKVIVVTEKMVTDYTNKMYPIYANKVEIIRNFSLVENIKNTAPIEQDKKGQTILIYVGGLTRQRGILDVVEAIQEIDNVGLWLMGPWENEDFQNACIEADVKSKLEYFGILPMPEVYKYIQASDIGLTILNPTVNHLASLPVKAFEYMAASKPQIMSNFPFWEKSFVDCVVFVDPNNKLEIQNAIRDLVENTVLRMELGSKSLKVVEEKYSWEMESTKLVDLYKTL